MAINDTANSVAASRLLTHLEKLRIWLCNSQDSLYLDGLTIGPYCFTFEDAAAGRPDDIDVLASYLRAFRIAEAEVRMFRDEFDEYVAALVSLAVSVRNPPVRAAIDPPADDPHDPWVARWNQSVAETRADHETRIVEQREVFAGAFKRLSNHVDQLIAAVDNKAPGGPRGSGAERSANVKWQDAQRYLEDCRLKGQAFTTQEDMAERVGSSVATINKAIKNGQVELQEWANKQGGESRLNLPPDAAAVALKSLPQNREPDPSRVTEQSDVEAMTAFLIAQAGRKSGPDGAAEAAARIKAMDDASRRSLAELMFDDPDKADQLERYRQAKKVKLRN